ncbi:MAG: hypothetical protein LBR22_08285 [Desulfovibrio sp.]|jgi:hypothetical protein|nr:hypothetical protein [Desulfovibrio sp.]
MSNLFMPAKTWFANGSDGADGSPSMPFVFTDDFGLPFAQCHRNGTLDVFGNGTPARASAHALRTFVLRSRHPGRHVPNHLDSPNFPYSECRGIWRVKASFREG